MFLLTSSIGVLIAAQPGAATNEHAPSADASVRDHAPVAPPAPDLAGSFPGSFKLPGSELSLKFGGRIKLDAIQDFGAIGNTDAFKTSTIPVPESDSDGNSRFHARDTRLHMEARMPSPLGELRGYVEGNFFGDGSSFTLRHAYFETDHLLAGQTWTNFMWIGSRPETLDFEGPDGSIFLRQAQLRWTDDLGDLARWSVAVESPTSDVNSEAIDSGLGLDPALGQGTSAKQVLPDLTAGLLVEKGPGHAYLSAVLRDVAFEGAVDDSVLGWGLSLSGKYQHSAKGEALFQIAYGEGIARYVEDLRGLGLDAGLDASGELEALPTIASFVGYRWHWTDALRSNVLFSSTSVDNSAGQAADVLHETSYAAANLIWSVKKGLELGVETLGGTRENNDGEDSSVQRLQLSATMTF